MKVSGWVCLAIVLVCAPASFAIKSQNPCHPKANAKSLGAPCQGIKMPPQLCQKCRLADYNNNGVFSNCQSMFKIDEGGCRQQLSLYSRMNKCDKVRAAQVKNFKNSFNRRALDYFLYSVCEECCDCVPLGAKKGEYARRKAKGGTALINVNRGNCPAHAYHDLCKVWPQIRHVTTPSGRLNMKLPKICPMIRSWYKSPASRRWQKGNVKMSPQIRNFLGNFNSVAGCRTKSVWEACSALESSQKRI